MTSLLQQVASTSVENDCIDFLTKIKQSSHDVSKIKEEGKNLVKEEIEMLIKHSTINLKNAEEQYVQAQMAADAAFNGMQATSVRSTLAGTTNSEVAALDQQLGSLGVTKKEAFMVYPKYLKEWQRISQMKNGLYEKICSLKERLYYLNERSISILQEAHSLAGDAKSGRSNFYA